MLSDLTCQGLSMNFSEVEIGRGVVKQSEDTSLAEILRITYVGTKMPSGMGCQVPIGGSGWVGKAKVCFLSQVIPYFQ